MVQHQTEVVFYFLFSKPVVLHGALSPTVQWCRREGLEHMRLSRRVGVSGTEQRNWACAERCYIDVLAGRLSVKLLVQPGLDMDDVMDAWIRRANVATKKRPFLLSVFVFFCSSSHDIFFFLALTKWVSSSHHRTDAAGASSQQAESFQRLWKTP